MTCRSTITPIPAALPLRSPQDSAGGFPPSPARAPIQECSFCGEFSPVRLIDKDGRAPDDLVCKACFSHEMAGWDDLPMPRPGSPGPAGGMLSHQISDPLAIRNSTDIAAYTLAMIKKDARND